MAVGRRLRGALGLAAVAVALAVPMDQVAAGSDPRADARELAALMRSVGYYDDVFELASKAGVPPIAVALEAKLNRPLTPVEHDHLKAAFGRALRSILPPSVWDDLYVDVMVKHVPAADLRELLRHYRTPAGTKALRLARLLAAEGARAGEELVRSRQDQFIERFVADLAASMPALKEELDRVPRR